MSNLIQFNFQALHHFIVGNLIKYTLKFMEQINAGKYDIWAVVVAQLVEGPRFESGHRQFYFLSTVLKRRK